MFLGVVQNCLGNFGDSVPDRHTVLSPKGPGFAYGVSPYMPDFSRNARLAFRAESFPLHLLPRLLEGTLARDFLLLFFFIKNTHLVP
jgi:hypothetical protein